MSNTYIEKILNRYSQKGIVVDTNLFLLWLVGLTNSERIEKFKRTKKYTIADYKQLRELLGLFARIVTTPHILAEVSNLANQLNDPDRGKCLSNLQVILNNGIVEKYVLGAEISKDKKFATFGIKDCGIKYIAPQKFLVLTDDFKLKQYLEGSGIDAINFENLRLDIPYLKKY
ncbi:MAG: PIN domain-containing protein [Cyanobacteria bacterium P01_G01_bin.54]